MRFLISLLLFSGCSSIHFSQGLIDPALGLHLKPEANDLSALYTSIQAEEKLYESNHFKIDIGAGPVITTPLDGRSPMYGAELSNRISYKLTPQLQPFFYHAHGFHLHESRWLESRYTSPVEYSGSDSYYEISTRIGLGVAYKPTNCLSVDLSYQWTHLSNGKTFLGDKTRQFFGLKKAGVNDGFESGSIFVGVQYKW